MLTPDQWNDIKNHEVNAVVIREAKNVLDKYRGILSTIDLVEAIYPIKSAVTSLHSFTRQRIYKALPSLAINELAAYAGRGAEQINMRGNRQRPWLWHAERKICPECKGAGYLNPDDLI